MPELGKQSSMNDYELIPIKPLYELKQEFQKLKEELKKDDSSSKILIKHLNLDIALQKKIEKLTEKQEEIKDRLNKVVQFFEKAIDEEEKDRVAERDALLEKLTEIEMQNKAIQEKIELLASKKDDASSKLGELRRDVPSFSRNMLLKYRRTKDVF